MVCMQLPPSQRQACIDRYRRLTPHVERSIARLPRRAPAGVCAGVTLLSAGGAGSDDLPALAVDGTRRVARARVGVNLWGQWKRKSILALDLCAGIAAGAADTVTDMQKGGLNFLSLDTSAVTLPIGVAKLAPTLEFIPVFILTVRYC